MRIAWEKITQRSIAVAILLGVLSCGKIKVGEDSNRSSFDDPVPQQATLTHQGSFTNLNGTVSGTAAVYRRNDGSSYVARLQDLSTTFKNGLQIVVRADGETVYRGALRGVTGNQNYNIGQLTGIPNFNAVDIENISGIIEGTALLERVESSN